MNLTPYIYKDSGIFYFDPENYGDDGALGLSLEFEDGDTIKWTYKGEKFFGVLREVGYRLNLFRIENVS